MANFAVRARGTSVEIYNAEKDAAGISGLPKVGSPLAASFAYASDHLPIFADIQLESSAPVINVSPQSLTGFSSVPGEPSPPQSAVVSGSNLASRIMATAPSGYEVSLAANGSYADSVDLIPSGGTIGPTAIFVRLKAGAPGTFQGDLQITSSGANPLNVALTGVTFASGALEVDSSAALDAEGPISGPFAPEAGTYVLRNSGAQPLEWTAEHDADWLALSATSGVLAPGDSFAVTAHLTPAASLLPVGSHRTILRFTNQTNDLGTTTAQASVFVGSFAMDGIADAPGFTVSPAGITLSVAVRGTKLYVATRVPPAASGAEDHHIFIADSLLPDATAPAPWAKRGLVAIDTTKPYLAAEGENKWSGWFQAPAGARLHRSTNGTGVLEGSIDLFPLPEFIYIAVVAYETRHAADQDASAGRVVSQVPLAVVPDDDITPDEFLKIPVRSITDSVGDGRFDALAPGRGFAAQIIPGSAGQAPELRWPTVPWRNYTVLRKSDLTSSVWEPIHSMKAGVHTWELSLPDAHGAERGFYKVEVFEPGF